MLEDGLKIYSKIVDSRQVFRSEGMRSNGNRLYDVDSSVNTKITFMFNNKYWKKFYIWARNLFNRFIHTGSKKDWNVCFIDSKSRDVHVISNTAWAYLNDKRDNPGKIQRGFHFMSHPSEIFDYKVTENNKADFAKLAKYLSKGYFHPSLITQFGKKCVHNEELRSYAGDFLDEVFEYFEKKGMNQGSDFWRGIFTEIQSVKLKQTENFTDVSDIILPELKEESLDLFTKFEERLVDGYNKFISTEQEHLHVKSEYFQASYFGKMKGLTNLLDKVCLFTKMGLIRSCRHEIDKVEHLTNIEDFEIHSQVMLLYRSMYKLIVRLENSDIQSITDLRKNMGVDLIKSVFQFEFIRSTMIADTYQKEFSPEERDILNACRTLSDELDNKTFTLNENNLNRLIMTHTQLGEIIQGKIVEDTSY
jgi:hypothetical protein